MNQDHTAEKDVTEREAIRAAWQAVIDADGWDADVAEDMYARAVDGIAWGLIEATMDTADREPSAETYHEARNTARRMMLTLAPRTRVLPPAEGRGVER